MLLSVCAWGLQYKLSLYRAPGTTQASVPMAKLLSQKERAPVVVKIRFTRINSIANMLLTLLACFAAFFLPALLSALTEAKDSSLNQYYFLPRLYSRPPPVHI
jgi:hypothetical protein